MNATTTKKRAAATALLASALVAGCGTASTSRNAWLYTGSDRTLDMPSRPIPPELRKEIADERRTDPTAELSGGLQARLLWDHVTWQSRIHAAIDRDRSACVALTGDSGEQHFWTGYDPAFLDCMKTRGWSRPTGSDPL